MKTFVRIQRSFVNFVVIHLYDSVVIQQKREGLGKSEGEGEDGDKDEIQHSDIMPNFRLL